MLPCRACGAHAAHVETVLFLGTCVEVCRMCHARTLIPRYAPPVEVRVPGRSFGRKITQASPRSDAVERILGDWLTSPEITDALNATGVPATQAQCQCLLRHLAEKGRVEKRRLPAYRSAWKAYEYRRVG